MSGPDGSEFREMPAEESFKHRPDYVDIRGEAAEQKIIGVFNEHGYVTFDGVETYENFNALVSKLGTVRVHGMTDENGITTFDSQAEKDAVKGVYPTRYELAPHIDGPVMPKPADILIFT